MSRSLTPVIAAVAFFAGLIVTGVVDLPTAADPSKSAGAKTSEDGPDVVENGQDTQSPPTTDDDQSATSSVEAEHLAEDWVHRVRRLAEGGTAGRAEANERVRKLFLAAHRGQSPLVAARVAELLIVQLPGTEMAAQAEAFRIVSHVQRIKQLDARTVQLLGEFSRNYKSSALPVQLYRWTGDQLTARGQAKAVMNLITQGIASSRGHRDVSELEAYLRMTKQTLKLASRAGDGSLGATARHPAKPSLTNKSSKYGAHLGKPLHLMGITSAGRALSNSSLRGNWTVVHFWATWCPKCVSDTPDLKPLYQRYAKQGVRFVGVSMDDDLAKLKKFTSDRGIDWPQVIISSGDDGGWDTPLAKQNGISSIPAVFLVSPDGVVVEAGMDVPSGVDRVIRHHLGL